MIETERKKEREMSSIKYTPHGQEALSHKEDGFF